MNFRTIQGCPVDASIAPYIAIVVNDAHATVNSIYRGDDARAILNKHGKHSQAQLYDGWIRHLPGYLPANPPGFSTHELKSDGAAYPSVPRGANLQWWQQGIDVNDSDVPHVIAAAAKYGWHLFQPYHSGSEFHHLNFSSQPTRPRPGTKLWARFWRIRFTLPRS